MECFQAAIISIIIGVLMLLWCLTETGRKLDNGYMKMLPKRHRSKLMQASQNAIGVFLGIISTTVGVMVFVYAIYCWWTGRPCDTR